VTSCGKGGIGEALLKEYTRLGLNAIATVLPSEPHEHLTEAGIKWFTLDLMDEKTIVSLKQDLLKVTGGYLDILVNNA
jgi:1-acylglycerone phosphate reductase